MEAKDEGKNLEETYQGRYDRVLRLRLTGKTLQEVAEIENTSLWTVKDWCHRSSLWTKENRELLKDQHRQRQRGGQYHRKARARGAAPARQKKAEPKLLKDMRAVYRNEDDRKDKSDGQRFLRSLKELDPGRFLKMMMDAEASLARRDEEEDPVVTDVGTQRALEICRKAMLDWAKGNSSLPGSR